MPYVSIEQSDGTFVKKYVAEFGSVVSPKNLLTETAMVRVLAPLPNPVQKTVVLAAMKTAGLFGKKPYTGPYPGNGEVTPTPTPSTPTPSPAPSPTLSFSNATASVTEGDSGTKTVANVLNVARNGIVGALTVNLTYAGTATAGSDYLTAPVSAIIAAGESSVSFNITINGDTVVEGNETIVMTAVLAAYSSASALRTLTITNDDVTAQPTVTPAMPAADVSRTFFAQDGATFINYPNATGSGAQYEPVNNKTWIAHEALADLPGNRRDPRVVLFNHTTGAYEGPYTIGAGGLTDDDHGDPGRPEFDSLGNCYVAYGSHDNAMLYGSTSVPRDPTSFTKKTITSDKLSYGQFIIINDVARLFMRRDVAANSKKVGVYKKSTSLTGGQVTFDSTEVVFVDFGTDSRWYRGGTVKRGTDIHMVATGCNYNDDARQNVYYFIMDSATGDIRNIAGTVTIPLAQQPITLAQAKASFMVVDQVTANRSGNIPSLAFSTNGTPYICYEDGEVSSATIESATFNVNLIAYKNGAWTAPVTVGTTGNRYNDCSVGPLENNEMQVLWPSVSPLGFVRGGDISRSVTTNGVWQPAQIVQAATLPFALNTPSIVENGRPELSATFSESPQGTAARTYPSAQGGIMRKYGYGTDGVRRRAWQPRPETQAYAARRQVQPTTNVMKLLDDIVAVAVDKGMWDSMDFLHLIAGDTKQAGFLNLKGDKFNLAETGTGTFTPNLGWQSDGTTGFLDTGFIPAVEAVAATPSQMQLNNHEVGVWLNALVTTTNAIIGGSDPTSPGFLTLGMNAGNGSMSGRSMTTATQGGPMAATVPVNPGLYATRRTAAASSSLVRSGINYGTSTVASGALGTGRINVARNIASDGSGQFSGHTVGLVYGGKALGLLADAVFYNAVRRYMTAIGAIKT